METSHEAIKPDFDSPLWCTPLSSRQWCFERSHDCSSGRCLKLSVFGLLTLIYTRDLGWKEGEKSEKKVEKTFPAERTFSSVFFVEEGEKGEAKVDSKLQSTEASCFPFFLRSCHKSSESEVEREREKWILFTFYFYLHWMAQHLDSSHRTSPPTDSKAPKSSP